MKKLVLTSVCLLGLSGAAFAQGEVAWTAITFAGFTAETVPSVVSTFTPGGTATGGTTALTSTTVGSYYYELLYDTAPTAQAAPSTLQTLAGWTDTGLEGENSATAGRAQVVPADSSSAVTMPFTTAESWILVGWSANLGSTYSAAIALLNSPSQLAAVDAVAPAYFGTSSAGYLAPFPSGSNPGATLFGSSTGDIHSLDTPLNEVVATPEPTTIALGVMGGLSLLALRRKKA